MRTIKPATILVVAVVTLFLNMRIKIGLAVLAAIVMGGCATAPGPNVTFRADDLDERVAKHEDIAVLPFVFESNRDEEKKVGEDDVATADLAAEGRKYQRKMYTSIMMFKNVPDLTDLTATVQDVDKTNAILEGEGRAIHEIPREELASLLGVDAVLSGSVTDNRLASGAAALGTAILTGLVSGGHATASPHTQEVWVRVTLHDGADGEMLWNLEETRSGGIGSSAEKMISGLMQLAAYALPYTVVDLP